MRLALLTYSYSAGGLGTISHLVPLVRELRKIGAEVDVFSFPFHLPFVGLGICTFSFGLRNLNNYDVIHSQEEVGFFVREKNHVVFIAHVPPREQGILDNLEFKLVLRKIGTKSKCVIVPSQYTKYGLIANGFPRSKPITVIRHGIDHDVFKPNAKLRIAFRRKYELNGFVALTVGRMTKRKNQVDILKALSQCTDVTLIFVGNGPECSSLLRAAKKLSVNLLHFNHVPKKELVGLYNAADVYLHTAFLEGFGFPLLEAISCGLPVIAYRTADFDYVVGDGGYIIEQGNINELRDEILCLKNSECERKKLGRKALVQSRKFSWTETAKKYLEIYERVQKQ